MNAIKKSNKRLFTVLFCRDLFMFPRGMVAVRAGIPTKD